MKPQTPVSTLAGRAGKGHAPVRVRATQANRRAATRAKVIHAAKFLLYSQGYTGTTTLAIRDAAALSTGGIQGQFPNKASIMAAVVEDIIEGRKERYRAALQAGSPRAVVEEFLDIGLELSTAETSIMMAEILLAKRNDSDLSAAVDPLVNGFNLWFTAMSQETFKNAGISARGFELIRAIQNSFVRGFGLEQMFAKSELKGEDILATWRAMIIDFAFNKADKQSAV